MKKFYNSGDIFIWFTGLGLGLIVLMIAGLLLLILIKGSNYYTPANLAFLESTAGKYFGQIVTEEKIPENNLPDSLKDKHLERIKVKIGNRDLYGLDFKWFDKSDIKKITYPDSAIILERMEFGNFHGFLDKLKIDGKIVASGFDSISSKIDSYLNITESIRSKIVKLQKSDIGKINNTIESLELKIKKIIYHSGKNISSVQDEINVIKNRIKEERLQYKRIEKKVDSLFVVANRYQISLITANNMEKEIPLIKIIKIYYPNKMNFLDKVEFSISKIWEFLSTDPRESNTEGGVFPAIFGTVLMVIIMSLFAVPFGIITALYLREYAKQGIVVRIVRIAVNNLAGVPSIVFGVFGLGFFIYFVGGTIDQLFYPERLPTPTWGTGGILWASLTLALLTVPIVIVSTEEALAAIPRGIREAAYALGSTKWQTMRKIVLPAATPGILTGVILAMARGAGEVAPLMITGVVKLAPSLPFDLNYPFFHLDRKFMHLGFHIYDVGFQSPNVEAALPMVYMTTLLLIVIVIFLNLTAMLFRNRLRKKYKTAAF